MSGYAIVQFITWGNGKSVLAVPERWLITVANQIVCYLPKANAQKAITEN
jgi:hypothetical protein